MMFRTLIIFLSLSPLAQATCFTPGGSWNQSCSGFTVSQASPGECIIEAAGCGSYTYPEGAQIKLANINGQLQEE